MTTTEIKAAHPEFARINDIWRSHRDLVLVSRKKKGAGKGYKEYYDWGFRQGSSLKSVMDDIKEDARLLGMHLCMTYYTDFMSDRWWDIDGCRAWAIKDYRSRITGLRRKYGLTYDDDKDFYNVD